MILLVLSEPFNAAKGLENTRARRTERKFGHIMMMYGAQEESKQRPSM